MIRNTRAAVLAGAVLTAVLAAAHPAAARDADWWQVDEATAGADTTRYLVDLGSAHETAPGLRELRVMMRLETNGATTAWFDATVRLDCAARRAKTLRVTEYDATPKPVNTSTDGDWISMPAGHPLDRLVCKGERDFERLADFVPPMDAAAPKK